MSSTRRVVPAALFGVAALSLTLAGCGSDGSDTPGDPSTSASVSETSAPTSPSESSATVPADAPTCTDVWQADATLPRAYAGCVDDTDAYVKADKLRCSSGQAIVRYADHWYAVPGGTIHQTTAVLDKDRDYNAAVRRCRA